MVIEGAVIYALYKLVEYRWDKKEASLMKIAQRNNAVHKRRLMEERIASSNYNTISMASNTLNARY